MAEITACQWHVKTTTIVKHCAVLLGQHSVLVKLHGIGVGKPTFFAPRLTRSINPDEVVAHGAAIQAASLSTQGQLGA